ncbi:MAG: ElyC/SanA/YdcF family protein [Eubacteriales bacterium]|nr:ElyC/SanA/YdcF family protein [Eubacteriales bacterium]
MDKQKQNATQSPGPIRPKSEEKPKANERRPQPAARTVANPGARPARPGQPANNRPNMRPGSRPLPSGLTESVRAYPPPERRQGAAAQPIKERPRKLVKKRNLTKMVLRLVSIVLLVIIFCLGFSIYLKQRYQPDILSPDAAAAKTRDAVLVLGCGLAPDGSPSPMLQERLDRGLEVYFKGAGNKLLLTGHSSTYYDEVKAMQDYVLASGVKPEDIFLDHSGFSTWESLKRAKDVFHAESLCIVSQTYHLYRALYLAESLGIDACAVSADTRTYRGQWARDAREVLARVKDIYSAIFQPRAGSMEGDYDLAGDGQLSW